MAAHNVTAPWTKKFGPPKDKEAPRYPTAAIPKNVPEHNPIKTLRLFNDPTNPPALTLVRATDIIITPPTDIAMAKSTVAETVSDRKISPKSAA